MTWIPCGGAQCVERQASNRKAVKPWFDSQCGSALERHLMLFHLGDKQSTRCGGPAWRKTCKQNIFCIGSGMTDTEHTTSGSNEDLDPSDKSKWKFWYTSLVQAGLIFT